MSLFTNYAQSIKINYSPMPGQLKNVTDNLSRFGKKAFDVTSTQNAAIASSFKGIGVLCFIGSGLTFKAALGATTFGGGVFWLALGILGLAIAHDMGELSRNLGLETTPDPREQLNEKIKKVAKKVADEGIVKTVMDGGEKIVKTATQWLAKLRSPREITLGDIEDLAKNTYILQAMLDAGKLAYENAAKTIAQMIPAPYCSRLEGNIEPPK